MITCALLSLFAVPSAATFNAPARCLVVASQEADYEKEIAAAGDDVGKLLKLAEDWKEAKKSNESKAAYKRVLEIDAENEEAHKGLRHPQYDGKWFESYSAMSKYKREETQRMADQGMARLGDEWVPITDLPYLKMGWAKNEAGVWVDPYYIRIAEFEKKMQEEGRQLRPEDSTWIHPDDFDKWQEGLWKCGEEWLDTEAANAYHGEVGHWWDARGERFQLLTTCPMDTLLWARWHADQTFGDLVRIFGVQPQRPPVVVVFKDITQFNLFAAGDNANSRQPAESSGFSSLHHAYFADSWYDLASQPPRFLGTGVGYWDASDEKLAPFGKHSVRHAAGIAYVEAITPSVQTIGAAISGAAPPNLESFWAEKLVPRWLYYGAATYVERYYKDTEASDPMWPRAWSLENLRSQGDLDSLETIFAFQLSLEAIPASARLINEAGLVVSYILDGNCGPVVEAHRAYKAALKSGAGALEAAQALQKAVIDNKAEFAKYTSGV